MVKFSFDRTVNTFPLTLGAVIKLPLPDVHAMLIDGCESKKTLSLTTFLARDTEM